MRAVVPLGISYTTFRLIGYLVDVAWGKIEAEANWVNFASYVAFFPQLVAGPIESASALLNKRFRSDEVKF